MLNLSDMGKYTGWSNIWRLYPRHNLKRGILCPLIICIVIWSGLFFTSESAYDILASLSEMVVSSFPSIIGFILAGYTILIGSSNPDILKKICESSNEKKSSLFQRTSATFAVVMGSLIITLLSGFIVSIFIKGGYVFWFDCGDRIFNLIILILLSYLTIYSLWSLVDITANLFNYSQFINFQNQSVPDDSKHWIDKLIDFLSSLKNNQN